MRKQQLQASPAGVWTLDQIPGWGITHAASMAANKPANGDPGYAYGCLLQILDATAENAVMYENTGSLTSATWTLLNLGALKDNRLVASGASLTITYAAHNGRTVVLAASAAITLPAMTGTGGRYRFVVGTTSVAVTITATAAHLYGFLDQSNDTAQGTGVQLPSVVAAPSTVITLDGSTKGGVVGDWVEIEDIATSKGAVRGQLTASGTEASPWS